METMPNSYIPLVTKRFAMQFALSRELSERIGIHIVDQCLNKELIISGLQPVRKVTYDVSQSLKGQSRTMSPIKNTIILSQSVRLYNYK